MEIKVIKKEDISKLISLINEIFDDYPIEINWTEKDFEMDMIENRISLNDSFFLMDEGQHIGFIVMAKNARSARIDSMGVIKSRRRSGLAFYLLQHVIEHLKWKKVNEITLEVISTHDLAIRFYKKHGFSVRRNLYSLIFNLNDYSPHRFLFKDGNAHIIHELSLRAEMIFHRNPNWQRTPLTLENSGTRYFKHVIYDANKRSHPIGYVVWGENPDQAYIVDIYSVNPEYALAEIIADARRFIREETNREKCIITNLPQDDKVFEKLVESGAQTLFKQYEMGMNIR
jgi:ribosomal protein S18 acetylase RimI-like enzyme